MFLIKINYYFLIFITSILFNLTFSFNVFAFDLFSSPDLVKNIPAISQKGSLENIINDQESPPEYTLEINGDVSPGNTVTIDIIPESELIQSIRSVTWFIDEEEQNISKTTLSLSVPVYHSPIYVTANILYYDLFNNISNTQSQILLNPIIADILWEGDTIVPFGYKGQRYAGPNSAINLSVKIQYIDEVGNRFEEKDFTYLWSANFEVFEKGIGKSSVKLPVSNDYLREETRVDVTFYLIKDSAVNFKRTVRIPVMEPRVLIYNHSPLYGLIDTRVIGKNSILFKNPTTISVYPYSFDYDDFKTNAINFEWTINDESVIINEGQRVDINVEGENVSVPFNVRATNTNTLRPYQKLSYDFNLSL